MSSPFRGPASDGVGISAPAFRLNCDSELRRSLATRIIYSSLLRMTTSGSKTRPLFFDCSRSAAARRRRAPFSSVHAAGSGRVLRPPMIGTFYPQHLPSNVKILAHNVNLWLKLRLGVRLGSFYDGVNRPHSTIHNCHVYKTNELYSASHILLLLIAYVLSRLHFGYHFRFRFG